MHRRVPIHCWGGLGSQLFSLALAVDLENRLRFEPYFVFHSAGVTKRQPELHLSQKRFKVETIDDFSKQSKSNSSYRVGGPQLKIRMLRSISLKLGALSTSNTTDEFNKVRIWTLAFRGHYSHRNISKQTVIEMDKLLQDCGTEFILNNQLGNNNVGIHYRLGDLLELNNKYHIPVSRICSLLSQISREQNIENLNLASDSENIAKRMIVNEMTTIVPISLISRDAFSTISILQQPNVFLGTNSKISLWIALLRSYFFREKQTWMPIEMRDNLEMIMDKTAMLSPISYY